MIWGMGYSEVLIIVLPIASVAYLAYRFVKKRS